MALERTTRDIYRDYEPAGKEIGVFPLPEGKRVLEIGVGSGALLEALRARKNEVYGLDVSKSLVEHAKSLGFEETFVLDISEEPLPFPCDYFDAVFCYEVFEHLTNPHRLFSEVRRTLKADRLFYFSVPAQEIDMGYGLGRHAFIYPGLLEKENLERFFMQMYFAIYQFTEPGPRDHLVGRSYALLNMKDKELPDIVEVITGPHNVRKLYGHMLEPEALEREIAREVEANLALIEEAVAISDWAQVGAIVRLLVTEFSEYRPMYLRMGRLLREAGRLDIVEGLLATVRDHADTPQAVREELSALLGE